MKITHEQARQLIERSSGYLYPSEASALQKHLDTCGACHAYRVEFLQTENVLKHTIQSGHPRPRFTPQELHKYASRIKRQVQIRQFLSRLGSGIQTLTWAGLTAAMAFGLVWLLNNMPGNTSEPAATTIATPIFSTVDPIQTEKPISPTPVEIIPTLSATTPPTPLPPQIAPPLSPQYRLTLSGHNTHVTSVAFSPDGKMLASADTEGNVNVWRVQDGLLLYALEAHDKAVTSVAFSPDGNTLATGGKDGKVHLWLAQSGAFLHTLIEDPGWVKSLKYSPNGDMLAISMNEYRVLVVNPSNSMIINSSTAYTRFDVSTGTTNNFILASSETAVWFNKTSNLPFGLNLRGQGGKSLDAVLSPDGKLLASGSTDQKIYLWQVYDVIYLLHLAEEENSVSERQVFGSLETILEGHTGWVNSVAFSPNQQYLISGAGDGTIKIWNLADGTLQATLTGHLAGVNGVDVSPDGSLIASGSDDGTVKIWGLEP